ncbi:MAG: NARF domain-containing protein [Phaeodactylibacter xiamenensis]|uniref:Nucleotidyltransferase-Associated Rossmannoid Fold domain-containing protein n=1 Tax=Phaeodactylibacter xiamenensis TaxID=1524460 RepID=A0A098S1S0_9BACT|nr:NARF domain-containing protein [Phaeodactylibacter xiamenensis]KGE86294.1 hypothetical protein IX84_22315 [Phaeodactylibacter xiamenensis]MCR9053714.1 hypothetical protein [bacterium]
MAVQPSENKTVVYLLWFFLIYSLLLAIGWFALAWHFQGRQQEIIDEAVNDIVFVDISTLDAAILDSKSISAQKLDYQFKRVEQKIASVESKLKKEYNQFIVLGIPATLIGLIAFFISVYRYVANQAKEAVNKNIAEIVKDREHSIINLIESYDDEKQLFKQKVISVYGEDDDNDLRNVLRTVGFDMGNYHRSQDIKQGQKYDLLIINNVNGKILSKHPQKPKDENSSEEEEKHYQKQKNDYDSKWDKLQRVLNEQAEDVCILYYCKKFVPLPTQNLTDSNLQSRINFATNPAQIYGNVLNSLKYQHHLSSKE